uniref:Uncharacterized protein n=1 Tax=Pinguiococcus pyrenoidosus TaxID=172671 RepID=A0A7R9Y822_9STRA|mmetsp:Transcript_11719/g.43676  ORF Transcript_11719/g.43676 Transcript_11719/m.43676 type:complete len:652 (+) Transcript_11719:76-2031(+)
MALSRDDFAAQMTAELKKMRSGSAWDLGQGRAGSSYSSSSSSMGPFITTRRSQSSWNVYRALWFDLPDVADVSGLADALMALFSGSPSFARRASDGARDSEDLDIQFCVSERLLDGVCHLLGRSEAPPQGLSRLAAAIFVKFLLFMLRAGSLDTLRCVLRGLGGDREAAARNRAGPEGTVVDDDEEEVLPGFMFAFDANYRQNSVDDLRVKAAGMIRRMSYGLLSGLTREEWEQLQLERDVVGILDLLRRSNVDSNAAGVLLDGRQGAEEKLADLLSEWPRFLYILRDRCLEHPRTVDGLLRVFDDLMVCPESARTSRGRSGREPSFEECVVLMTTATLVHNEQVRAHVEAVTKLRALCVRCFPLVAEVAASCVRLLSDGQNPETELASLDDRSGTQQVMVSKIRTILSLVKFTVRDSCANLPDRLQAHLLQSGVFAKMLEVSSCLSAPADSPSSYHLARQESASLLLAMVLRSSKLEGFARGYLTGGLASLVNSQFSPSSYLFCSTMLLSIEAGNGPESMVSPDMEPSWKALEELEGTLRGEGRPHGRRSTWTLQELHVLVGDLDRIWALLGSKNVDLQARLRQTFSAFDEKVFVGSADAEAGNSPDGSVTKDRDEHGTDDLSTDSRVHAIRLFCKKIGLQSQQFASKID